MCCVVGSRVGEWVARRPPMDTACMHAGFARALAACALASPHDASSTGLPPVIEYRSARCLSQVHPGVGCSRAAAASTQHGCRGRAMQTASEQRREAAAHQRLHQHAAPSLHAPPLPPGWRRCVRRPARPHQARHADKRHCAQPAQRAPDRRRQLMCCTAWHTIRCSIAPAAAAGRGATAIAAPMRSRIACAQAHAPMGGPRLARCYQPRAP
jgi:hypothetical protein